MLNRREFLGSMAAAGAAAGQAKKPNIIVILADDMGFSDIGCYGGEIETPHIDSLASRGVRFTQMYNTARCCPTRASLLTGLYSHQAGIGRMVEDQGHPSYRGFLNDRCVTVAEALRPAGYRTLMSGKWHVGGRPEHWPRKRGFDRYYGLVDGGTNYFRIDPERTLALDDERIRPEDPDYYVTDAFTDHALKFMDDRASGQPFFLYLAYTSPHWPLHARPADIRKYEGRYRMGWDQLRQERHQRMLQLGIVDRRWPLSPRDPQAPAWADEPEKDWQAHRMAVYAAQVDRMDQNIGRVLAKLRQMGEEDNTLVLFLSDNGGCAENIALNFRNLQGKVFTRDNRPVRYGNTPAFWPGPADTFGSYGLPWANASNTPLRLYKQITHEGGIATPLVARWPSRIRKHGAVLPQVGHVIDILPTCLDAAGVAYPRSVQGREIRPVEGESLLPALRGTPFRRKRPLFWEHFGNRAVRDGDWKLVARNRTQWELYNLAEDRTELRNRVETDPARAAGLERLYNEWAQRCGVLTDEELKRKPG